MAATNLPQLPDLEIEGLEYVYRPNFEGRAEMYNDEGNRYFNARIPNDDLARAMERDGWNVKWTKPGKNASPEAIAEHIPVPYLEVTVGFRARPPQIILIKNRRPTPITERTVAILDSTEFSNIDVVVRARPYEINGRQGYKAYLKEFYGTVELSNIAQKYAFLDDSVSDADEDEI